MSHDHSHDAAVSGHGSGHGSGQGAGHRAWHATDHVHHSHVIVSQRVLLSVLAILLVFTFMTVGAAQAEAWMAHTFNIVIPQWVNVAVALLIAAVKTVIVAAYFMQLRYDNPINSCIAVFTVFVLAFFFGFIMIDLGNRATLYDWKGKEIKVGGTGMVVGLSNSIPEEARKRASVTLEEMMKENQRRRAGNAALIVPVKHLYHYAELEIGRLVAAKKEVPQYLREAAALGEAKYGPAHKHEVDCGNTSWQSRPKSGITLVELGATPTHGGAHGGGHKGEHAAPGAADRNVDPKANHTPKAGGSGAGK